MNDLEPLSSEKKNNGILINGGVNSLDEEEEKKKLNILKKQIKETKEENDDKINNYEVEDTETNNKEKKEEIVIEPISKNSKHNPPYWNEKTMDNIEDEIFEISDEKSDKIFELFNNIRLHSKDYINQSNDENISNLLEKSSNYSLKPNALIKSQSLYFQFREGLMNNYATPRDDETLLEDIYNAFFNNFKLQNYFFVECPINNEEESVWKLLKKYENVALQDLLNNNVSYCLICAMPIKDSYDMKVYFMMLNE